MKKNILTYFVFLLFLSNSYNVSARDLKTNIDLFGELYYHIFQMAFRGEEIPDSSRLVIQQIGSSATNWLIENEIIKWARDAGFNKCVIAGSAGDAEADSDYLLQYNSIASSVEYDDNAKSGEIGRNLKAELYLKLLSPSRQVLFSGIQKKTLHDAIGKKDLQRIENEKFSFTMGKKNRSFLSILLQPAILSIVTGGIIYLFYSYRSQ